MNSFKKFFVWGMNAKFYMGLYFTALVFLVGLMTWFLGGETLKITTLLQMILSSMVIALVQVLVLPDSVDFSKSIFFGRSVGWLLFATACITITALLGDWFAGLPTWCPWLLGGLMLVGSGCMLVGLKFEQEADTLRLNSSLIKFQQGKQ